LVQYLVVKSSPTARHFSLQRQKFASVLSIEPAQRPFARIEEQ